MRTPSDKVAARNAEVLERIRALKREKPFWGYRYVWAHLRFTEGLPINPKRVYRLMQKQGLLCPRNLHLRALRTPHRKPRPDRPNQWWGIDMTKAMTEAGWAYVVFVKDWYTKKIVGHEVSARGRTAEWRAALDKALNRQFPEGARDRHLHLMSDNGSQPTSRSFMAYCGAVHIEQAFTCYNNPKGNADTERVMRTLKEELVWLREWRNVDELKAAIDLWVEEYNQHRMHSALGYRTPNQAEEAWNQGHMTLNQAA